MVSFIESGLVFVNGKLITSNGYEPKEAILFPFAAKDALSMMVYPDRQRKDALVSAFENTYKQ